jgi:hypothetical protein
MRKIKEIRKRVDYVESEIKRITGVYVHDREKYENGLYESRDGRRCEGCTWDHALSVFLTEKLTLMWVLLTECESGKTDENDGQQSI